MPEYAGQLILNVAAGSDLTAVTKALRLGMELLEGYGHAFTPDEQQTFVDALDALNNGLQLLPAGMEGA